MATISEVTKQYVSAWRARSDFATSGLRQDNFEEQFEMLEKKCREAEANYRRLGIEHVYAIGFRASNRIYHYIYPTPERCDLAFRSLMWRRRHPNPFFKPFTCKFKLGAAFGAMALPSNLHASLEKCLASPTNDDDNRAAMEAMLDMGAEIMARGFTLHISYVATDCQRILCFPTEELAQRAASSAQVTSEETSVASALHMTVRPFQPEDLAVCNDIFLGDTSDEMLNNYMDDLMYEVYEEIGSVDGHNDDDYEDEDEDEDEGEWLEDNEEDADE